MLMPKAKRIIKYLLTPKGIKEKLLLTERFIIRKKKEYNQLQKEFDALVEKENVGRFK